MRKGILIENNEIMKLITRDNEGLILYGMSIGDSDAQNIQINIEAMPGDSKEYPAIGAGIYKDIKGPLDLNFYRRAGISLEMDGYNIKDVEFATE